MRFSSLPEAMSSRRRKEYPLRVGGAGCGAGDGGTDDPVRRFGVVDGGRLCVDRRRLTESRPLRLCVAKLAAARLRAGDRPSEGRLCRSGDLARIGRRADLAGGTERNRPDHHRCADAPGTDRSTGICAEVARRRGPVDGGIDGVRVACHRLPDQFYHRGACVCDFAGQCGRGDAGLGTMGLLRRAGQHRHVRWFGDRHLAFVLRPRTCVGGRRFECTGLAARTLGAAIAQGEDLSPSAS